MWFWCHLSLSTHSSAGRCSFILDFLERLIADVFISVQLWHIIPKTDNCLLSAAKDKESGLIHVKLNGFSLVPYIYLPLYLALHPPVFAVIIQNSPNKVAASH